MLTTIKGSWFYLFLLVSHRLSGHLIKVHLFIFCNVFLCHNHYTNLHCFQLWGFPNLSRTKIILLALFNSYSDHFYKSQTSSAHIFFHQVLCPAFQTEDSSPSLWFNLDQTFTSSVLVRKYWHKIGLKQRCINTVKIYQCIFDTATFSSLCFNMV